jgi:hypothetical protein
MGYAFSLFRASSITFNRAYSGIQVVARGINPAQRAHLAFGATTSNKQEGVVRLMPEALDPTTRRTPRQNRTHSGAQRTGDRRMITLTEKAKTVLATSMPSEERMSDISFRFNEQASGDVRLEKGTHEEGDLEFDYEGKVILRIPPGIADRLNDASIDVTPVDDEGSYKIVVRLKR